VLVLLPLDVRLLAPMSAKLSCQTTVALPNRYGLSVVRCSVHGHIANLTEDQAWRYARHHESIHLRGEA
jgi:hypothetical protein